MTDWKKVHGDFLKYVLETFQIDKEDFAVSLGFDGSTVRRWILGSCFPRMYKEFLVELEDSIEESTISNGKEELIRYVLRSDVRQLKELAGGLSLESISAYDFAACVLKQCHHFGTNTEADIAKPQEQKNHKTTAIVFDFDGTISKTRGSKTTWEKIWIALGYDVKECQNLANRYYAKEFDHPVWCEKTEIKFIEKGMNRRVLMDIAEKVELLEGVEETFIYCYEHGIKIYVVSGSILPIIKKALGPLCQYVDRIMANDMLFDSAGNLIRIIGTSYDFEGKADFITKLVTRLRIEPKEILFVGNSINDRFAYQSGARTLCINPKHADVYNKEVWNDCIYDTDNLTDILKYVDDQQ